MGKEYTNNKTPQQQEQQDKHKKEGEGDSKEDGFMDESECVVESVAVCLI